MLIWIQKDGHSKVAYGKEYMFYIGYNRGEKRYRLYYKLKSEEYNANYNLNSVYDFHSLEVAKQVAELIDKESEP